MANPYRIRNLGGLIVPVVSSDPSSPEDGTIWYNSTSGVFKKRENGATAGLASSEVSDAVFRIVDDGDATKKLAFEISGVATSTTRTVTMPNANVDLTDVNNAILKDGSRPFTADQSMGGFKLTNLADPSANGDAVNLSYLNARIAGVKPKAAVRAASTGNVTIASGLEDGDTLDGVTLAEGDRVLLKDQSTASQNGIYIVSASGAASRSTDFDSVTPIDEINGAWVAVQEGTVNAGKIFVQFGSVADVGTDDITFEYWNPIAGLIGGDMITFSGSTFSVDLASDAGLESSNPGNAAGQLRVKLNGSTLDRSSSGLKVADAGITETQLAASVAGAGLSGGAGSALSVNVDDSTIEINTDTLRVKDAGITDAKIAGGVSATKIGAGSVDNTEFGYLDGVTSGIQGQLDGKANAALSNLASVAINTSLVSDTNNTDDLGSQSINWKDVHAKSLKSTTGLTLDSDSDAGGDRASDLTLIQKSAKRGKQSSALVEEEYFDSQTLTDNTTAVLTALTVAHASYNAVEVEYLIKEATSLKVRVGRLMVVTNGSAVSISDTSNETDDVGVVFSAAVNGANLEISYAATSTGNNRTMRADVKRFRAI